MATTSDASDDNDVRRINWEGAKIEAEARKVMAEATKLNAEQYKLSAEQMKLERDARVAPWLLLAQGALAAAALMGAGAALAKPFLS